MNFFSPKNKSYLIRKPYSEVIDYLNTLEEKRKFQSDIYGGLDPGTSDEYVFATRPGNFRMRTLLNCRVTTNIDKTEISTTITSSMYIFLIWALGIVYTIIALLIVKNFNDKMERAAIGLAIVVTGIFLDYISKKILSATFERCLNDLEHLHPLNLNYTDPKNKP